jgi:predicted neuraminidase
MAPYVHCPTITEITAGKILAVWYGGTWEATHDVALYMSTWDPNDESWSPIRVITDARHTGVDLLRYVRTIGNPVVFTDPKGKIYLFYVTSIGGWSAAAVNVRTSMDEGQTWTRARRLVLSPFLNISTHVKCTPFLYADGSLGLPVYHEFLGDFTELVRLSPEEKVLDKIRISYGRQSRQPSLVPIDAERAVGLLRYHGHEPMRLLMTRTQDRGQHWTPPVKTHLPNPDAAVMGLRISDASLLLVFNNCTAHRNDLSLARSLDEGRTWGVIHSFEHNDPRTSRKFCDFSYPFIIQAQDGRIHVIYAWNQRRIKHVVFNEAWLRGREGVQVP